MNSPDLEKFVRRFTTDVIAFEQSACSSPHVFFIETESKGEEFTPVWLKEGDTIELEITGLGKLSNKIVKASKDYSILAKKKSPKKN